MKIVLLIVTLYFGGGELRLIAGITHEARACAEMRQDLLRENTLLVEGDVRCARITL